MDQKERLALCSTCTNRKLDFQLGYVCQLTGNFADFKDSCKDYERDDTVTGAITVRTKERPFVPLFDPVLVQDDSENKEKKAKKDKRDKTARRKAPSQAVIRKLRKYQSFPYALIGGLLIAAVASLGWAFFSVISGYQGIYPALAVGLIMGITVRYFGAGVHWIFGILAALLTLCASIMGYFFSLSSFPEEVQLAAVMGLPVLLDIDTITSTMLDTFIPLDLLFYILAILLAFLLAIRRINSRKMARLEIEDYKGSPTLYWLRLPLILALILLPVYFGYTTANQESAEQKTLYYESGAKRSEGIVRNGLETGEWTSWYEQGSIESIGYYAEGIKDSLWKWYDESGYLKETGMYLKGVENGTWIHYYFHGAVSDSGTYLAGLKEGLWNYFHETGELKSTVSYKAGKMHGEKILLSTSGTVVKVDYFENGILVEQNE